MRKIYITGDIGSLPHGEASFIDFDTGEELFLTEVQITLAVDKKPTVDYVTVDVTGEGDLGLRRARLVACPETPSAKPQVEVNEDVPCKHTGWVSHDIQGDNRFWCRECDERFINHPLVVKKEQPTHTQVKLPNRRCSGCGYGYDDYCPRCHMISYNSPSD